LEVPSDGRAAALVGTLCYRECRMFRGRGTLCCWLTDSSPELPHDIQMLSTVAKLKQIKARLQGTAEAAVAVPYEVTCVCGEPVAGMRRKSWIEAECQTCLQSVFVLPANVYPSTPSVPSEILGGSFADRLKVVLAEVLPKRDGKDVAKEKINKRGSAVEPADVGAAAATAMPPQKVRWRLSLPSIDIKAVVVRTLTPFRLLMLAMIAIITLTGYWMTYQQAIEAAHQTWLKSADEAQALLEDKEFLQLQTVLTAAVDAGRVLGKDDPEWRATLNLLQETQAINSIAGGSLLLAFRRAYDDERRLVDGAEALVGDEAGTGTFVFDSYLQPHPVREGVFLMDFPATPTHRVEVTIPIPQISALLRAIGDQRVLFAGRIQYVEAPAAGTSDAWNLQLDPTSFVLLTHTDHCEQIGLSPEDDPDVTTILTRQRDFVESSEQWEHRVDDAVIQSKPEQTSEVRSRRRSDHND